MTTIKKVAATAASLAMLLTATPAFAAVNSTSITIVTTNSGVINNDTSARSHTGQNIALGSMGGAGGNAGSVNGGGGSENNGGASAGNGGNGGNGGAGGLVETGNASADAGSDNSLNGTDVTVDFTCDCGDINSVTLTAVTDNDNPANAINNDTRARARTGQNVALGSLGGEGGTGGEIAGAGGSENNGGASAGNGGSGGAGGLGGTIGTGNAVSTSGAVNLMNTTFVRVRM